MTATMQQAIGILQSPAQASPQEGVWRYGVRVLGIKKRCRKSEWHYESNHAKGIGETAQLDRDLAVILAKKWINENMKTAEKAFACVYWFTFEGDMETWQMMNKDHNVRIPITI